MNPFGHNMHPWFHLGFDKIMLHYSKPTVAKPPSANLYYIDWFHIPHTYASESIVWTWLLHCAHLNTHWPMPRPVAALLLTHLVWPSVACRVDQIQNDPTTNNTLPRQIDADQLQSLLLLLRCLVVVLVAPWLLVSCTRAPTALLSFCTYQEHLTPHRYALRTINQHGRTQCVGTAPLQCTVHETFRCLILQHRR